MTDMGQADRTLRATPSAPDEGVFKRFKERLDNMNDLKPEVLNFAQSLEVGLFGTAENMQEAIKYAYMGIESLDQADKIGAYTALHVVLNTVALELRRLAGDHSKDITMLGGDDGQV